MNESETSSESQSPETTKTDAPRRVESKAANDPLVRLAILTAMLFAAAVYCIATPEDPPEAWDFEHVNPAAKYALYIGGPIVFFPAGIVSAFFLIRFFRRKLQADQDGIGFVGKTKVAWENITEIDASLLKSKGILKLLHGDNKALTLDSWKLTNFRELVSLVESKVPAEKMKL